MPRSLEQRRFRRRTGSVERACGLVEACVDMERPDGIFMSDVFERYRTTVGVLNLWDAINKLVDEKAIVIIGEDTKRRLKRP